MKFDFLPFKVKFMKTKLCYAGGFPDLAKLGDVFEGVVDFEDRGGINSKYITLYNNNPKFCRGTSPATEGNNIYKTPYVYSFLYLSFNNNSYAKETIEKANTKEKVFNYLKLTLEHYGYKIIKEIEQNFEEIEL